MDIKAPPATPYDIDRERLTRQHELTVLVMVGLPARGKSFISKKLERFLLWRGEQVKIFNVGERRRMDSAKQDASFFAKDKQALREEIAQGVLMEMVEWLRTGHDPEGDDRDGADDRSSAADSELATSDPANTASPTSARPQPPVRSPTFPLTLSASFSHDDEHDDDDFQRTQCRTAIFDATNSSIKRRRTVAQTIEKELGGECQVVFVESLCEDEHVLERNLLQKIAMSPDYRHLPREEALADLRARIAAYESQYESLASKERLSYIKLFNLSSQLHLNLIYGMGARPAARQTRAGRRGARDAARAPRPSPSAPRLAACRAGCPPPSLPRLRAPCPGFLRLSSRPLPLPPTRARAAAQSPRASCRT